jgi:hypothetical protein
MMGEMDLGLKDKEFLLLIMDSFAAGLCTFEAEITVNIAVTLDSLKALYHFTLEGWSS